MKYTKRILEPLVKESVSVAGVLRKLGLPLAGGIHTHISRRIKKFGIDTSHFLGQGANCGPNHKGSRKRPWQEVLVLRAEGYRERSHILRRALLESGREYRCESPGCLVRDSWQGKPFMLHVNRWNGSRLDDRPENLELLCPNCHSQTPNYCGSKGLSQVTKTLWWKKRGPVVESGYT